MKAFVTKNIVVLLIVLLTAELSFSQLQGNYTINSAQLSGLRNFQSFGDFVDTLNAIGISDTVLVSVVSGSGPYNEQVIFSSYSGMSKDNPIIINGNNQVIQSQNTVMNFNGSKHFTIDSLQVKCLDVIEGVGIEFENGSDSNKIINCVFDMSSVMGTQRHSSAIYASSSSALTIEKNRIHGNSSGGAYIGIALYGPNGNDFNNTIKNNSIRNFYLGGIRTDNQANLIISQNDISSPDRNGSHGKWGISLLGRLVNSKISRNKIHDFGFGYPSSSITSSFIGIQNAGGSSSIPNRFENNIIHNLNSRWANVTGIQNLHGGRPVEFYNNTIILNSNAISGKTVGFEDQSSSSSSYLNNLIEIKRNSSDDKIAFDFYLRSSNNLNCDFNNVFISSQGTGSEYYCDINGTKFNNLSALKASHPSIGQSSLEVNPMINNYMSYAPQNVHLIASGDSLGVMEDYYGNHRGVFPEIGAVETWSLPLYDPSEVTSIDIQGVADSLGLICYVTGTVVGINLASPTGLNFYIINQSTGNQEGLLIKNETSNLGYQVTEGDSLMVRGIINQDFGVVNLVVDSIIVLSSLRPTPEPFLVNNLNESTESKLVRLTKMMVVSGGDGNSNEMVISDGTKSFKVKLDSNTNINDSLQLNPMIVGDTICSIIGIGSQIDSMIVFDSNYIIIPFRYDDFNCEKYRRIDTILTCNSYQWVNGTVYDSSVFVRDTLINSIGCDSVITLMLTINNSTSDTVFHSNCDSYYWPQSGHSYTQSGMYHDTIINFQGCDSIIKLELTIYNSTDSIESVRSCNSFFWNRTNTTYNESGTYFDSLVTNNGCDSIYELNLFIDTINLNVSQNGLILSSLENSANYQWLDCSNGMNAILGANSQSYTVTINGTYAVEVTQNSCVDTSNCITINSVGLNSISSHDFSVFPNPTNGEVYIIGRNDLVSVEVFTIEGRFLQEFMIESNDKFRIDYEAGVYLIKLKNLEGDYFIKKIFKK